MNIVIICHYFYPEIGAPSARIYETAKHWVQEGHQVTVVTCFPNHPTGIIPETYRGLLFKEENLNGIRVLRNFVYATPNEGFIKKTLGHISFMVSSVLLSLPKLKKQDIIIVSSPTFFSVFSAFIMSSLKRVPLIFEVRDLWPEAIVKLGVLKNNLIIKILEYFEMCFYRYASKVIVVTNSFKDNLVSRGIDRDKIEVITNGVDESFFAPHKEQEIKKFRDKHNLEDKFVLLYSGAHGMSHALERIIEVAYILKDSKNIFFLFVGEGAEKKKIIERSKELGLENVSFLPGQLKEAMPLIYGIADVCLVPLKKIDIFKGFIPSKIFEIMASQKPILASLDGEAKEILLAANCAIVVKPESTKDLVKAIKRLDSDKNLRYQLALNGKNFVKKNYTRNSLAHKYLGVIKSIIRVN